MMEERIENCLKGQVPPSPQIPARPIPYRGRALSWGGTALEEGLAASFSGLVSPSSSLSRQGG